MTLDNVNKTSDSMARLMVVFSDLYAEITRIKNYYGSMKREAQKSFTDSQNYWEQKSSDEKQRVVSQSGEKRAKVDEMIRGLDSLETQLCAVDKSYAKRRETEFFVFDVAKEENYPENTDYFNRLKNAHDEAVDIARECSMTVKAQPIQEIGMLFSNKRKSKYERLYQLILETKHLRKIVFDELDKRVGNQNEAWFSKKNEEIEKAALETAELIEAIDSKEKEEIATVINRTNMHLDNLLSLKDVATLKELKALLDEELPEECCEHILLGNLKVDVSSLLSFKEALDYINIHYAGCFSDTDMVLPAIYDMRNNANFVFDSHGVGDVSKEAIHAIMYAMLKNQPASKQQFVLSDPEGRSRGFDLYLDFAKQYPDIFGERILTTKEQIKFAIKELSRYVDDIGQTKLVGYRDIFEYNADVTDKQESLRCLCLLNFPKYFDEDMLEDLYNIAKNGKCYGVQVLIDFDERELTGRSAETQTNSISRIMAECVTLENRFGKWKCSNGVQVSFISSPTGNEMKRFVCDYAERYKEVKNASLPLLKIVPEERWFDGNTGKRLEIPIGKNEEGVVQSLIFGEGTSHHAMVIGSLGSGKSTLLHTIIMSSLMSFSPDEINLYLMDFKSGTEFKVYAGRNIPHIKLLALDAMQEFGQSILDELWNEMNRRSDMFNELINEGLDVKDITDYRRLTGKKLPRILVVADEFQLLVSEEHNRKIANYCGGKLADFISLSRVYGIHFILATQTMSRLNSGFAIRKSTINEMYVRIGLKCTENECGLLFGDKNGKSAFGKMGTEKGSAVYAGDYVQGYPIGFKVAYCEPETQTLLLDKIEEHYSLMECSRAKVFVGNSVPKISESLEFKNGYSKDDKALPVYLGEPIKIASATKMNLSRTKRNNLLIVGSDQERIENIISLYMLNVLHCIDSSSSQQKKVYLFDGLTVLGEDRSLSVEQIVNRYSKQMRIAEDNFESVRMVEELYTLYLDRKESRQTFGVNAASTVAVVINNVQWLEAIGLMLLNKSVSEFVDSEPKQKNTSSNSDISDLLASIDSFMSEMNESKKRDTTNISHGKKLLEMIEHGYTCGIHFVLSVPDYISIKEHMYGVVQKFSNRIVFAMSNDDASRFIGDAKTEQLKNNIVIYYDGIKPSYQIKPYSGVIEYINSN